VTTKPLPDADSIREALAAYAHDAWAGWMQWLFKHGEQNADGTFTINADKVARWQRQMMTPYAELPEGEKESDRKEADQIFDIASTGIIDSADAAYEALVEARQRIAEMEYVIRQAADWLDGADEWIPRHDMAGRLRKLLSY
jgi:hypothetical protein